MNYAIIQSGNIPTDDSEWHLHWSGCKDLKNPRYNWSEAPFPYDGFDSPEEVVADWIDEDMIEMGWLPEHVRVFPCTAPRN